MAEVYRNEAIEHALHQMFRRVLNDAGSRHPTLDRVTVDHDRRDARYVIICDFLTSDNQRLDYRYSFEEWDILALQGPRPRAVRFEYDARALWSRVYEDHYMGQIEQATHIRAVAEIERTGDMEAFYRATEETRRLREHVYRHHTIPAQYLRPPPPVDLPLPSMTATEVRALQQEYVRGAAARIDQSMVEAMYGGMSATRVSADEAGSLTLESITNAMQALANNYRNFRWQDAFRRDPMSDWMYFGLDLAADGIDVGTKEAQEKGRNILLENLTARQRTDYEKHNHFHVTGGESGKTYRIKHGRQMNIAELDKSGTRVCGWCFLPQGGLVAGDVMLAQKVALELYEGEALKIANRFP